MTQSSSQPVTAQESRVGDGGSASKAEALCPRCRAWKLAKDDTYCGFCGHLLLKFSIEPEREILVAGLGEMARRKKFVLKNGDGKALEISVIPAGSKFPGLIIEPPRLQVSPGGTAEIVARLDEAALPARFAIQELEFLCMIGGDRRRSRVFRLEVNPGPRPVVPKVLSFGPLQEGTTERRTLKIRNDGGIPAVVDRIEPEGTSQLSIDTQAFPARIPPGGSFDVDVVWNTETEERTDTSKRPGVRIHYRNVSRVDFVGAEAKLYRFAVGASPEQLHIKKALSKQDQIERVELLNRGTIDVEIADIEADQKWIEIVCKYRSFTLLAADPSERRPLPPGGGLSGEVFAFEVICHPRDLPDGKHEGKVTVWLQGGNRSLTLPVTIEVIRPEEYREYIGIDFGTTNSVIAVFNEKRNTVEVVEIAGLRGVSSPLIPSVLTFVGSPDTYKIGHDARSEAQVYPDKMIRSIKRIMGYSSKREFFGREFAPEQLASFIIRKLVQVAETRLFESTGKYFDIKRAIVAVPANFYDLQVQGVLTACSMAGIDVEEKVARKVAKRQRRKLGKEVKAGIVLDEPSAAALYFLHHLETVSDEENLRSMVDRENGLNLLVFDYGGGTLDVSVTNLLRLKGGKAGLRILANMGNNKLGGDSIDLMVMQVLLEDCRVQFPNFDESLISGSFHDLEDRRLKENWKDSAWSSVLAARMKWKDLSEGVKIDLSDAPEATVEVPPDAIIHLEGGEIRHASRSHAGSFPIRRFEDLLRPTLDECERLVRAALSLAEMSPNDVDYVLHSGRQSLVPAIYTRVCQIFPDLDQGRNILDEKHLKVCVAQGAAIWGQLRSKLQGKNVGIELINEGRRLPHGYGTERGGGLLQQVYEGIIPRGTPYPADKSHNLDEESLPSAGLLRLKFYQNTGAGKRLADNPEIRAIGEIETEVPEGTRRKCEIRLHIDANRRLEILVNKKPVVLKSLRQLQEEDWLG